MLVFLQENGICPFWPNPVSPIFEALPLKVEFKLPDIFHKSTNEFCVECKINSDFLDQEMTGNSSKKKLEK